MLRAFARHGAATASSDEIVHGLLRDDPSIRAAIVERFGPTIRSPDGAIDRARLAAIVFDDRDGLAWLEALLHPHVVEAQRRWREELAARADPPALCVLEIPLLYETGGEGRFDAVVMVTAPAELRHTRRGGDLAARERRLLPDEEKAARADFVYVNDGSLEDLDRFVAGVVATLTT